MISGIIEAFLHVSVHARTVPKSLVAPFMTAFVRLFSRMPKLVFLEIVSLREFLPTDITLESLYFKVDSLDMSSEAVKTSVTLMTLMLIAGEPLLVGRRFLNVSLARSV